MAKRKRRSAISGRAPVFSPGRPGIARREDRRRFWGLIALGGPDTADVDAPLLFWSGGGKILVEDIGGNRAFVVAVHRFLEAALLQGFQAIIAHEPGNAMTPDGNTVLVQLRHHARAAIGLIGCPELGPDMGEQNHVLALAQAWRATFPGLKAAFANVEQPAGTLNRHIRLLCLDDLEPHFLVSLAKKAAAS